MKWQDYTHLFLRFAAADAARSFGAPSLVDLCKDISIAPSPSCATCRILRMRTGSVCSVWLKNFTSVKNAVCFCVHHSWPACSCRSRCLVRYSSMRSYTGHCYGREGERQVFVDPLDDKISEEICAHVMSFCCYFVFIFLSVEQSLFVSRCHGKCLVGATCNLCIHAIRNCDDGVFVSLTY
jgi:hypothetical protein